MERIILPNSVEPVSEQDFIMLLRRLSRDGGTYLVLWLGLSQLPVVQTEHRLLEKFQEKLSTAGKQNGADFYSMTNGDTFLVKALAAGQKPADATARILAATATSELQPPQLHAEHLHAYVMPADYSHLRERLTLYVEAVHDAAAKQELTAEQLLKTENVQGPLTAWSLAQVERLFDEIDLRPYIRKQAVYKWQGGNKFQTLYYDFYLGVSNLQRAHFPKLELNEPARLLMELRHSLDMRVLREFLEMYDELRGQQIFLNLSIDTAMASTFIQFCHAVPNRADRAAIGFEIHRSDWFLDFAATQSTLASLKQEGFRTGLDAATPDLLPYIRLDMLQSDQIKIFVERSNVQYLHDPDVLRAIKALSPERVVFARCDTEAAWEIGCKLGITQFHGWYLDDMMANEKSDHS